MTDQYYKCSIPHTKTSTIPIDIEAKYLTIDVGGGTTLELDFFLNVDRLNLEWIKITGIQDGYLHYNSSVVGGVFDCLKNLSKMKSLIIEINCDNSNWCNFDQLNLRSINIGRFENLHNQIIFPSTAESIRFVAFSKTIESCLSFVRTYIYAAFQKKNDCADWKWSCDHYDPNINLILCSLDKQYATYIYGTYDNYLKMTDPSCNISVNM
jgi:hypothetical protein